MADEKITSVNTVPESGYLSDFREGERLSHEQRFYGKFVRRPIDGPMHPAVEDEGSWINRKKRYPK